MALSNNAGKAQDGESKNEESLDLEVIEVAVLEECVLSEKMEVGAVVGEDDLKDWREAGLAFSF